MEPKDQTSNILQTEKRKIPFLLVFVTLILGIVIGSLLTWFYLNLPKAQTAQPDKTIDNNKDEDNNEGKNHVETKAIIEDKLFFINSNEKNNLYYFDISTNKEVKVFEFSNQPDQITGINTFNKDFVGIGKCNSSTGDFGCDLNYLDLKDNKLTIIKTLPESSLLLASTVYSQTKYAYLITTTVNSSLSKFQLIVVDEKGERKLEDIKIGDEYGRGGYEEDSEKIRFSPDGKYLLHISTSSPRATQDMNTYVYNLSDNSKVKISNSTHPEWVDNNAIIYRKPSAKTSSLYLYDVTTKTSKQLSKVSKNSYEPMVNNKDNTVLYTDLKNQAIYKYSITDEKVEKLLDKGVQPIWINNEVIAYVKTGKCINEEDCPLSTYSIKGVYIYNLSSKEEVKIPIDSLYYSASLLGSR